VVACRPSLVQDDRQILCHNVAPVDCVDEAQSGILVKENITGNNFVQRDELQFPETDCRLIVRIEVVGDPDAVVSSVVLEQRPAADDAQCGEWQTVGVDGHDQ
jgi:hypothetical protein